jgi:lipid-binding SYLF domain-containing protein
MIIRRNKSLFLIVFLIVVLSLLIFSQEFIISDARATSSEIINETIKALEEMSSSPDSGIFKGLLKRAEGIAIFPSITEIAIFGIGVQKGDGLVLRKDSKTGIWYGPAFLKIKSGGIGARMGIQSIDLFLVINNKQGLEAFMEDSFKFGGTLAWTVGPIGRSVSAEIDSDFNAPIYSYSITKGLYFDAGSLQGSTIKENSDANKTLYGEDISNRTILETKISKNAEFLKLLALIKKISK